MLEISGVCSAKFVVIKGPAVEIQVIRGFTGNGANDHSGLATEQPLEIQTIPDSSVNPNGDCESEIRARLTNTFGPRDMSIISTNVSGAEQVRWNLFEYEAASEKPGSNGTVRFTLEQTQPDNNSFSIDRDPSGFPYIAANNPATDKRVEISGITTGYYPAVEMEDTENATLILVYDHTEAGGIFDWVKQTITTGTQTTGKRDVSVIVGSSRQNYYGCFPANWSQFTGFTQYILLKEHVTPFTT